MVFAPDGEADIDEATERRFLSLMADQLRGVTRRSDVLGRIGPREFAILAPDTSEEGARVLADRLRQRARSNGNGGGPGAGHEDAAPGAASVGGRAGICAIRNLKESGLDPLELVVQATLASRNGEGEGGPTLH